MQAEARYKWKCYYYLLSIEQTCPSPPREIHDRPLQVSNIAKKVYILIFLTVPTESRARFFCSVSSFVSWRKVKQNVIWTIDYNIVSLLFVLCLLTKKVLPSHRMIRIRIRTVHLQTLFQTTLTYFFSLTCNELVKKHKIILYLCHQTQLVTFFVCW